MVIYEWHNPKDFVFRGISPGFSVKTSAPNKKMSKIGAARLFLSRKVSCAPRTSGKRETAQVKNFDKNKPVVLSSLFIEAHPRRECHIKSVILFRTTFLLLLLSAEIVLPFTVLQKQSCTAVAE